MRRMWIVTVAAALVVVLASLVQAAVVPYQDKPLNRQNVGLIRAGSTARQTFVPLPGWGPSDGPGISARGAIVVTVSITVEGGPVALRVVTEAPEHDWKMVPMRPSSARLDPGTVRQSFSYTFVTVKAAGPYIVDLYWRSPIGAEVTETGGSVVIQYAMVV